MKKTLALVLGCMLMGGMFAGCDDNYDDDIQAYCEAAKKCDTKLVVDTCVADAKKDMDVCKSEQAALMRCLTEKTCAEMSSNNVCSDETAKALKCAIDNNKKVEETEEETETTAE